MIGKALFTVCLLALATQQAFAQNTLDEFCPDRTSGGNSKSAKCASKYTYKGKTYTNQCTNADHDRFWCSTTEGVYSGKWGNCLGADCTPFCKDRTSGGTAGRAACVFPFRYRSKTFNSCTRMNHNRNWCSANATYSGTWGNCEYDASCAAPYCTDRTKGGKNAFGAPCVIPFTYQGTTYNKCINLNHNQDWCSTTATYSGSWGNCLDKDCKKPCNDRTQGGTANGAPCVFPFRYKGKTYTKCTFFENRGVLWCSTTSSYSGQWGRCVYEC